MSIYYLNCAIDVLVSFLSGCQLQRNRMLKGVPVNLFLSVPAQYALVFSKECAFDIFLLKSARIIEVVAWCAGRRGKGRGGGRGALAGSRGVTYIPVNTPAQSTLATGTFGAFDEPVHLYK